VFDDMSLKTALHYDKLNDSIVGYENYGEFGCRVHKTLLIMCW